MKMAGPVLLRTFDAVEGICSGLSAFCYASITFIIFIDVIGRYLFNSPLQFTYTLVSNFLIVAAFFLSMSYSEKRRSHISVDVAFDRFPKQLQNYAAVFNNLLGIGLASLIAYGGYKETAYAYNNNLIEYNIFPWPMWVSYSFVPIGMAVYIIRMGINIIMILNRDSLKNA